METENMWITDDWFLDFKNKKFVFVNQNGVICDDKCKPFPKESSNTFKLIAFFAKNRTQTQFKVNDIKKGIFGDTQYKNNNVSVEITRLRNLLFEKEDQRREQFLVCDKVKGIYFFNPPLDKPPPADPKPDSEPAGVPEGSEPIHIVEDGRYDEQSAKISVQTDTDVNPDVVQKKLTNNDDKSNPVPKRTSISKNYVYSYWQIILKKKLILVVCTLAVVTLCIAGIMKAMHSTTDDNTSHSDTEANSDAETSPDDSKSVISVINDTTHSETNPVPGYEGVPESYNMECFVGRTVNGLVRQFYDHDVSNLLDELGLSKSYGVLHFEYTFPADEVDAAPKIYRGQQQGGSQNGMNASDAIGYSLQYGDTYYIFFIKSINYSTGETTSPQTKPTQIETRTTTTDNTVPTTETAGESKNKADTPVSVVVITVPVDNGSHESPTNPSNDNSHYEPPVTQEQTAAPQPPVTQEQTVAPQPTADFPDIEISSVDARKGESDVCVSVTFKNLMYRGGYSSIDMNFNAIYSSALVFKQCTFARDESEITGLTAGNGQVSFDMHGNYCENDITVNLFFDIPNDAPNGDYEIRIFEEASVVTLFYPNNWINPYRVLQSLDRTGQIHVS